MDAALIVRGGVGDIMYCSTLPAVTKAEQESYLHFLSAWAALIATASGCLEDLLQQHSEWMVEHVVTSRDATKHSRTRKRQKLKGCLGMTNTVNTTNPTGPGARDRSTSYTCGRVWSEAVACHMNGTLNGSQGKKCVVQRMPAGDVNNL